MSATVKEQNRYTTKSDLHGADTKKHPRTCKVPYKSQTILANFYFQFQDVHKEKKVSVMPVTWYIVITGMQTSFHAVICFPRNPTFIKQEPSVREA
jgi:hypothetical protein